MDAWKWTGGEFAPCDSVPVSDRGFRYGMSLFESFPVCKGNAFFLKEHLARLKQSCTLAGFGTPLPDTGLFAALLRGISFDAFARIYVTAGGGGVFDGTEHGAVFLFVEPRAIRQIPSNECFKLALHPDVHIPILGGLKTANYWSNLLALQKARIKQCDEALLFNPAGRLVSACMANAFIVVEGKIKTPAISSGARAGVIREWVIGNRSVRESSITREDLSRAEEIFLTSSGLGMMPVASLAGRKLPSREVASQLLVEYGRKISEVAAGG